MYHIPRNGRENGRSKLNLNDPMGLVEENARAMQRNPYLKIHHLVITNERSQIRNWS